MRHPGFFVLMIGLAMTAQAGEVMVAVAANFSMPMQPLIAEFERDTGHKARLVLGATGKLHAQITNGAPFDVFLAADDESPAKLEQAGVAFPGSRFTYATGKLVLWSARSDLVDAQGMILREGNFPYLALANPRLAAYGKAAMAVLDRLGLTDRLRGKFVIGENIAQTHQFVASGNAPLGFVAMGQVFHDGRLSAGSAWMIPPDLYPPIRQDAVLLQRGKDNPAARDMIDFLKRPATRVLIRRFGYEA